MPFIPRIFVPKERITGKNVFIDGSDANHVRNVLRIPIGGQITVCDGEHTVYPATVLSYTNDGFFASLSEGHKDSGEFPFPVTVYQCYPKGEKAETVVQKSVELGASEIVFVMSERCVARPDEKTMQKKLIRLNKIAASAAAQCGRSILPAVRGLLSYADACAECALHGCALLCYEGDGTTPIQNVLRTPPQNGIAFLVGPEGGISPKEVQTATAAGLTPVGLGHRILRTETAALFVLAAVNVLCI